jgi:hypothetical protein
MLRYALSVRMLTREAYRVVFAQYTVEDWDYPPTEPPAVPRPPDFDSLSRPQCSSLYSIDTESDADTAAQLEAAMNSQSDASRQPPFLRRRLSTLIIVRSRSMGRPRTSLTVHWPGPCSLRRPQAQTASFANAHPAIFVFRLP